MAGGPAGPPKAREGLDLLLANNSPRNLVDIIWTFSGIVLFQNREIVLRD